MNCILGFIRNDIGELVNFKGPKTGQMNMFCKTNVFWRFWRFKVHKFTGGAKNGIKGIFSQCLLYFW
jgi:hypothetical protein